MKYLLWTYIFCIIVACVRGTTFDVALAEFSLIQNATVNFNATCSNASSTVTFYTVTITGNNGPVNITIRIQDQTKKHSVYPNCSIPKSSFSNSLGGKYQATSVTCFSNYLVSANKKFPRSNNNITYSIVSALDALGRTATIASGYATEICYTDVPSIAPTSSPTVSPSSPPTRHPVTPAPTRMPTSGPTQAAASTALSTTTVAAIIIAVLVFLIILIIAGTVYWWRKQQKKKMMKNKSVLWLLKLHVVLMKKNKNKWQKKMVMVNQKKLH